MLHILPFGELLKDKVTNLRATVPAPNIQVFGDVNCPQGEQFAIYPEQNLLHQPEWVGANAAHLDVLSFALT